MCVFFFSFLLAFRTFTSSPRLLFFMSRAATPSYQRLPHGCSSDCESNETGVQGTINAISADPTRALPVPREVWSSHRQPDVPASSGAVGGGAGARGLRADFVGRCGAYDGTQLQRASARCFVPVCNTMTLFF